VDTKLIYGIIQNVIQLCYTIHREKRLVGNR
jgi:hypothetical protein